MSVYNGESFLSECIQSILNQSYTNFEFICINDGSEDNSLNILETYAIKDKRIKIINKNNSGLTKSLNIGIAHAKGDYIARIDSDDLWHYEKLAKQLTELELNNDIVLLGTSFNIINEKGNILLEKFKVDGSPKRLPHTLLYKNVFCHSSVIFKKFNDIVYDEKVKYGQDYHLWLRLMEFGKIKILDDVLVSRRVTNEMISITKRKEQLTQMFKTQTGNAFTNVKYLYLIPKYTIKYIFYYIAFSIQDLLKSK